MVSPVIKILQYVIAVVSMAVDIWLNEDLVLQQM